MRKAVIFGVTGQDGSYLSELLLSKNYTVIGVSRRSSTPNTYRIAHLATHPNFKPVCGDVTDATNVNRLLWDNLPDEVYNLAAQSHVKISFDEPIHTTRVVYEGCLNILEAIRTMKGIPVRFYQASSSEMFGVGKGHIVDFQNSFLTPHSDITPLCGDGVNLDLPRLDIYNKKRSQNESTPYLPCSPYGVAKLAAHNAVRVYRESYGLHASSGILFNHESERRGDNFVTQKIASYVGNLWTYVKADMEGRALKLELGNLDASRDWGHAEDYVYAMWLMLQQNEPDDYVIGTGETHTVRDFLSEAFKHIGRDWKNYVVQDESLLRPCEVPYLCADSSKAKAKLGWVPKITFSELVRRMVENKYASPLRRT